MDNSKYARLTCAITWFIWVSLVFQLVGYFTPGWALYVDKRSNGSISQEMIGLWYVILCDNEKCVPVPLSDWGNTGISIVGPQVETTLALFLCIVAVYITHKKPNSNSTEEQKRILSYIHMTCCALSSILSITAVTTWITFAYEWYIYWFSREDNSIPFPYSLPFTGLGGVLAGLAFLTNITWRPWKHDNPVVNYVVPQNIDTVYDPATQTDNVYPLAQMGNVHLSKPKGNDSPFENVAYTNASQQYHF